jgi:hypothetical protein
MTESAGSGPRGRGRWLRNLWEPRMHGESAGESTPSAWGTVPGSLRGSIRRFLGFGLMRASGRLRAVLKDGEPIRARARLKSVKIEEKYYFHQHISLNPFSEVRQDPDGLIKLVLPYDGEKYFTRQAHKDVTRVRERRADPDAGIRVGFLALTGYQHANLSTLPGLEEYHGSFPIDALLPPPPGPGGADPLLADDVSCVVSHEYHPTHREQLVPPHIDVELYDPDTADIPGVPDSISAGLHTNITRQVDFKPELLLRMTVSLRLPRELADATVKVRHVFIGWPTRTSLSSLRLRVAGKQHDFQYNPEREFRYDEERTGQGGLEWHDVAMDREPEPAGGDFRVFESPPMDLSIPRPGDLYHEDTLVGQVEVTVDRLLSGTEARLFDATGRLCRQPELGLKTVISTEFSVTLDDAFSRRLRQPHQLMFFGEVIPTRARIDDVTIALQNRGFEVTSLGAADRPLADAQRGVNAGNWWLAATRPHGPDELALLLHATGKQYLTRRERRARDGMRYQTTVDSGDLELYAYGFLPGDSEPLVNEMNALRSALRHRFDRLPDRR